MSHPLEPDLVWKLSRAVRKEKAIFCLTSENFMDDLKLLSNLRKQAPRDWEAALRHLRNILERELQQLPLKELREAAYDANPQALWQMPASLVDTPKARRRLVSHAMRELMHRLCG